MACNIAGRVVVITRNKSVSPMANRTGIATERFGFNRKSIKPTKKKYKAALKA